MDRLLQGEAPLRFDKNLRLLSLVSFLKVVEEGGRAAAGRALKRDPSLISRDISALESWLAAPLFDGRGSTELSETGEHFVGTARAILALLDTAKAVANPPPTPMKPKVSGRDIKVP